MSSCLWWFCIAVNMFLMVVIEYKQQRLIWVYHSFVWGLSTSLLIKVLIDGSIHTSSTLPYCWSGGNFEERYFIIPVGVFVFSTVILVVIVMFKLSYLSRKLTGTVFNLDVLSGYLRPIMFLLIVLFPYLFIFAYFYKYYGQTVVDIKERYLEYLTCNTLHNYNSTICGTPNFFPNFGLAVMNETIPCILGILSFLCYGLQKRWIILWQEKFTYGLQYVQNKGFPIPTILTKTTERGSSTKTKRESKSSRELPTILSPSNNSTANLAVEFNHSDISTT